MPQFDLNSYYSQIFWLVITFSLLYIFVYKFIVPVAEQILYNRRINIKDNVEQADKLAIEAEKLNKYYNAEVAKLSNKMAELKKAAIDSLESDFVLKKTNLENDLKKQINQNISYINLAAKEFWQSDGETSIKLAARVIEKITGKEADINLLKNITKK